MDILNLLADVFEEEINKIKTALEESAETAEKAVDWLSSSLVAYAKKVERQSIYSPKIMFQYLVFSAITSIKNGLSQESYYETLANINSSQLYSGIEKIAGGFCKSQGVPLANFKIAIDEENDGLLTGILADFAKILISNKKYIVAAMKNSPDKYDNENEEFFKWCVVIIASYCWTETAIREFMYNRIGNYFDRWKMPNSEERFPYAMNTEKYTWYRKHGENDNKLDDNGKTLYKGGGKETWGYKGKSGLEDTIKKYEKAFNKTRNRDRYVLHNGNYYKIALKGFVKDKNGNYTEKGAGAYINTTGKEFIEMSTIPYWYVKEGEEYRITYDMKFDGDGGDANARCGKGSPEILNYVAEQLKNNNVDFGEENNKNSLRKNLMTYGIGIDCSGFVSRAIYDIMVPLQIPYKKQLETMGPAYGRLKTNATTLRDAGSERLFYYKYSKTSTKGKIELTADEEHDRVFCPGLIKEKPESGFQFIFQPGDIIMYKKVKIKGDSFSTYDDSFHILIIRNATEDSFEVMQSTSVDKKGPITKTYKNLDEFLEECKGQISKSGSTDKIVEFARPLVFTELKALLTNYIDYLKRGE